MSHWQLFIIISTFVYMTIAFGAYAYLTRKLTPMLPYAGAIPAFRGLKEPEKFLKLVALVVSFGWPVLLAMYGYVALIQKMGKLAGIKWDEFVDVEMMKEISKSPAKAFNIGLDNGVGAGLAANIQKISFEIVLRTPKDPECHVLSFESPERIAYILTDREPFGEVLQSFLRDVVFGIIDEKQGQRTGEIDAEFESTDEPQTVAMPDGSELRIPTTTEINDAIINSPVGPMTRLPDHEEVQKLDQLSLAKLAYAVGADRAAACRALSALEEIATNEAVLIVRKLPGSRLERGCVHARAVVDAWVNLVK